MAIRFLVIDADCRTPLSFLNSGGGDKVPMVKFNEERQLNEK
jgi:hypothetical protein